MQLNLSFIIQRLRITISFLGASKYGSIQILLACLLLLVYIKELIYTAWISDDAMITFRVVLNFIHGYGANFNIIERVQAYTHPLWFGLLSLFSFFTKDIFFSTFLLSFTFSVINITLLFIFSLGFLTRILVLLFIIFSKAFVDYSTSGLENPLSHFLIFLFFLITKKLFSSLDKTYLQKLFFISSFMYLARPDLVVLAFPVLIFFIYQFRNQKAYLVRTSLLGFSPVILWTLFSLWYYGFPFPNTAYAKLQLNISRQELIYQGFLYIVHTIYRDPVTLLGILLGVNAGIFSCIRFKILSCGIILQVVYVIYVGGDFMEGRFLTPAFFLSTLILSQTSLRKNLYTFILALVITLGIYGAHNTIFSDLNYQNVKIYPDGIADERGYYFQDTGLLTTQSWRMQIKWDISKKQVTHTCGSLGALGITSGPGTHIIDTCGLSEPLLARLPLGDSVNWKEVHFFHRVPFWYEFFISKKDSSWRIGHFKRNIPSGYIQSFVKNKNVVYDVKIKKFYDHILEITSGSLWSLKRLETIWYMNTRKVEIPNHKYEYEVFQEGKFFEIEN